ncbi:MAG: hypothetical protein JWN77_1822 [Frankiales bacterium]|nr:hypothetical protein [Frankiales bacterium]
MLGWLRDLFRGAAATPPVRGRVRAAVNAHDFSKVLAYRPRLDGKADPGEIIWTLVAFEDNSGAKDRPLLVVARKDPWTVLALMLSSQPKRPAQRNWLALGPGAWDPHGRDSWVRLDRVLEVADTAIRREAAVLDRERFAKVALALRDGFGWAYPTPGT